MSAVAGLVTELWRIPVEPMGGERVRALGVTARGIAGDRVHEVLGPFGAGEAERLAAWRAGYPFNLDAGIDPGDPPWAVVTGGRRGRTFRWGDPRLASALETDLGRPVELRRDPGATRPVVLASGEGAGVNVVLELPEPEAAWIGRTLAFAGGARLEVVAARPPAGVLARVMAEGRVAVAEAVTLG